MTECADHTHGATNRRLLKKYSKAARSLFQNNNIPFLNEVRTRGEVAGRIFTTGETISVLMTSAGAANLSGGNSFCQGENSSGRDLR